MFEKINIFDIRKYKDNPRKISYGDLEKLEDSIGEFGLVDPIIISLYDNQIIGGHQRYAILLKQGVSELNLIRLGDIGWVFTEDDLKVESEEHEKALNIALNKISGEWDNKKLNELNIDLNNLFNNNNILEEDVVLQNVDEIYESSFTLIFDNYELFDEWLRIIDMISKEYEGKSITDKIINFIEGLEFIKK